MNLFTNFKNLIQLYKSYFFYKKNKFNIDQYQYSIYIEALIIEINKTFNTFTKRNLKKEILKPIRPK